MIELLPLGAGQDVGRSCIIVRMGGKTIMLDCGMHMGYKDSRRFPNFALLAPYASSSSSSMTSTAATTVTATAADGTSAITPNINYTSLIDCVIISHFHLDHSGALPHFTEQCGYDGPIYMTDPTRAISAILLNDFRKIQSNKRDEQGFFTENDIKNCMRKVITVQLHETVHVDDDLEIRAYYAGHVLGAAMFHLKVKSTGETLVYTGDYNMTPDRHLGSAWIDRVNPDVLITESTYATTVRDSRRAHERDFVTKVHNCVKGGGKVLIPVFALGRAQELCILLDSYWDRMNLGHIPVYFSAGLTEKANNYYKLFINWTNQKVKDTFVERNIFDFKHIRSWDPTLVDSTGPMVLFASPGMLHQGTSLDVFKKWAPFENNMVIMPGYCVAGTVGYHVLQGVNPIKLDQFNVIQVNLKVECLSFSAHADAKGIMQLIRQSGARHVVLVHGEKQKMGFLQGKIEREFGIPCSYPANGESCKIETRLKTPLQPH
ncbi:Metallo-hydrolase/oxidoreductase [Ramicandelaber brevisporus]|nr:Metallo-hydrolase/oxidoreductase [Ramicandelaber brevisporus]